MLERELGDDREVGEEARVKPNFYSLSEKQWILNGD
jgi:hypothetical protein